MKWMMKAHVIKRGYYYKEIHEFQLITQLHYNQRFSALLMPR